jgi:nucleotide-binding universal stress UspA family protein
MRPFQRILLPTDFSACSAEAQRAAAELAQRYDATLELLHVFEPILYMTPEGHTLLVPGQLEDLLDGNDRLLDAAKKAAEDAGAPRVRTRQEQGVAASEIVEVARRDGFDLIVIGTHGRTGLKHALLGSVAERVVRRAPCPVLTIRTPAHAE